MRLYGKSERNIFVSYGLATEGFEELPQILEALQTRAVTLGNQRARRKNHAVVQIFDAKLKMQTVVDSCRQLIDFLFIYRIDGIQR